MPVYLVTDVTVHDPERYRAYSQAGHAAALRHGGRFLVEGGRPEPVEGNWQPRRMAILEFSDREAALAFYHSPEYADARERRSGIADFNMVLVAAAANAPTSQE